MSFSFPESHRGLESLAKMRSISFFIRGGFQVRCLKLILCMLTFLFHPVAFAHYVGIVGQYIIHQDTTYSNVMLDLSQGYFDIQNNAKLVLNNCIVIGTLSPQKPNLIMVGHGSLVLKNNRFKISTVDIMEDHTKQSLFSLLKVLQGKVTIVGNEFLIMKPYTASLLVTDNFYTSDFNISHNRIKYFHGGFILKNSHRAYLAFNQFTRVSISNILLFKNSKAILEKNEILFSGNNNVGDGIDLIDSEDILLNENYLASGSCYSIVILRGKNISLLSNMVIGGITYAIYISGTGMDAGHPKLGSYLMNYLAAPNTPNINLNIKLVNNYLAQNRYGLAASDVIGLMVEDNIFIQKFLNDKNRIFWTNNEVLLRNVTQLTWLKNRYKEAYPQDSVDDGKRSSHFAVFPPSGGVKL